MIDRKGSLGFGLCRRLGFCSVGLHLKLPDFQPIRTCSPLLQGVVSLHNFNVVKFYIIDLRRRLMRFGHRDFIVYMLKILNQDTHVKVLEKLIILVFESLNSDM